MKTWIHAHHNNTAAKIGGTPLLAVATEEGSVHVLNTSKRMDWDPGECFNRITLHSSISDFFPEPPRTTFQPHSNGIFDVKWNAFDTLLATCSGDQSTRVSCPTTGVTTAVLRGHTSTVKCVSWDPSHQDLLSTGGRDGKICVWDLRVSGGNRTGVLSPVMTIQDAHEESAKSKGRGRKKALPLAKSVTNLLYHRTRPDELISSGSFDGYVTAGIREQTKLLIVVGRFVVSYIHGISAFQQARKRSRLNQNDQFHSTLPL